MTSVTRIGLGTVQLGMEYGITNRTGQPDLTEAGEIVRLAGERGVRIVDTAAVYGQSESVLGQILDWSEGFRIVTKTPPLRERAIGSRQIDLVRAAFKRSLNRMGVPRVDALLVHHAEDLLADGGDWLWEVICEFRQRGLAGKIGVSVYNDEQLLEVLDEFEVELVQLPLNVLDQRAVSNGLLNQLRNSGIEIHARSAFLQGILIARPQELPDRFAPLRPHLERYHRFRLRHNLTAIKAALAFVLQHPVDCCVVGAARVNEFEAVLDAAASLPDAVPDFSEFACDDERFINPTLWAA